MLADEQRLRFAIAVLLGNITQRIGPTDAVDHGGKQVGAFGERTPDRDTAGGAPAYREVRG